MTSSSGGGSDAMMTIVDMSTLEKKSERPAIAKKISAKKYPATRTSHDLKN